MDWVRLAEPLAARVPDPQLPRARSIARGGGVTLTWEAGLVRATVQRGGQASVAHIEVARFDAAMNTRVAKLIGNRDLLADADRAALEPLAIAPKIISVDCSCPARKERCVHVQALLYALAAVVDQTPRVSLDLRAGGVNASPEEVPPEWQSLTEVDPATFYG